jgi:integrase
MSPEQMTALVERHMKAEGAGDVEGAVAVYGRPGVRHIRIHDARHTAATLLVEQGVHIRVVQGGTWLYQGDNDRALHPRRHTSDEGRE